MIGLSNAAKDEMLSIFTGQPLLLGLFTGEAEIADAGYERQVIEFGSPQDDGDVRVIENENEIRFDVLDRDHTLDHWGVFSAGGTMLALYRLVKPRDMPADDNPIFRPGNLSIGLP